MEITEQQPKVAANSQRKVSQLLQPWFEETPRQNIDFTCFLCGHVLTGTIVIGFLHILFHLSSLTLITIALIHPKLLGNLSSSADDDDVALYSGNFSFSSSDDDNETLPYHDDGGSPRGMLLYLGNMIIIRVMNTDEVYFVLFLTLCTFFCTLLLMYGAFFRRPSCIFPFFYSPVFSLCMSSMTMVYCIFYLPDIHQIIRDTQTFPFQQQLLRMDTKRLKIIFTIIFMIILMAQSYFLSIVWRCYLYLISYKKAPLPPLFQKNKKRHSSVNQKNVSFW